MAANTSRLLPYAFCTSVSTINLFLLHFVNVSFPFILRNESRPETSRATQVTYNCCRYQRDNYDLVTYFRVGLCFVVAVLPLWLLKVCSQRTN